MSRLSNFKDRVVFITGASEGIGRALALRLAADGARLALIARNEGRLEQLADQCRAEGAEAIVITADVTVEKSCRQSIQKTIDHYEKLDVLVNNAGMSMASRFDELKDLSVIEQLMQVNFFGSVYCTHEALPHLEKTRGMIVAVASMTGLLGIPFRTGYCASKHAMIGFFDALRGELKSRGISVVTIAPDFVQSEIRRRALGSDGQPTGETTLDEDRVLTAEGCAEMIVRAMKSRKRLLITSTRGKLGYALKGLIPGLIDRVLGREADKLNKR